MKTKLMIATIAGLAGAGAAQAALFGNATGTAQGASENGRVATDAATYFSPAGQEKGAITLAEGRMQEQETHRNQHQNQHQDRNRYGDDSEDDGPNHDADDDRGDDHEGDDDHGPDHGDDGEGHGGEGDGDGEGGGDGEGDGGDD